ncbi:uncharacterized protein LY89DRAFT_781900 [Mollisia scopiformis]|uniref:2EXR domain-containing protein n=1 Tax=Mollisia scopiformis TaxID=149040 RepID=A0A194XC75_MOLSC|nr:uncharacterized protein LY89DRAFT_781900 [Mollisia scopiformis]KUJ17764.1 hypothetical protein LY89DRAFT_781900 [Mollisia scopiformis]
MSTSSSDTCATISSHINVNKEELSSITKSSDLNNVTGVDKLLLDLASTSITTLEKDRVFHVFPNLPVELRLKIWEAACLEARVIRFMGHPNPDDTPYEIRPPTVYSKAKVPAILHVNNESRQVALVSYTLWSPMGCKNNDPIYFNHSLDFMYIACRCSTWGGPRLAYHDRTFGCGDWVDGTANRIVYELQPNFYGPAENYYLGGISDVMLCLSTYFPKAEEKLFVGVKEGLGGRFEAMLSSFKNRDRLRSMEAGVDLVYVYRRADEYYYQGSQTPNHIPNVITAVAYEDPQIG